MESAEIGHRGLEEGAAIKLGIVSFGLNESHDVVAF